MKIDIREDDLFLMLSAAMRYSVGRRSYIVGSCAEWVRTFGPKLSKISQGKIIYSLEQEMKEKIKHMEPMDKRLWDMALKDMRKSYERATK